MFWCFISLEVVLQVLFLLVHPLPSSTNIAPSHLCWSLAINKFYFLNSFGVLMLFFGSSFSFVHWSWPPLSILFWKPFQLVSSGTLMFFIIIFNSSSDVSCLFVLFLHPLKSPPLLFTKLFNQISFNVQMFFITRFRLYCLIPLSININHPFVHVDNQL